MKRKFFKGLMVAVAAISLMTLSSCSRDEDPNDVAMKTVRFQLVHETGTHTRGVGPEVANGTAITTGLSDAHLYFMDANYQITKSVEIDFTATTSGYDPETEKVSMSALTDNAGVVIDKVPGSSTMAAVIGNLSKAASTHAYPTTGTNMKTALVMDVQSQYDNLNFGVAKVTLYGDSVIEKKDNAYSATLKIRPIVSRIELGKVSGSRMWLPSKQSTKQTGDTLAGVRSFTLAGIYINNYYPKMAIMGQPTDAIVFNGTTAANYSIQSTGKYENLNGILCDEDPSMLWSQNAAGVGSNTLDAANVWGPVVDITTAMPKQVWAYNVLAPWVKKDGDDAPELDRPHLIIHLQDIVAIGNNSVADGGGGGADDATTYQSDKWLTVRNIYLHNTSDGSNTLLTSWKRGYVYRIENLYFGVKGTGTTGNDTPNSPDGPTPGGGGDDPQPNPETTTIDVTVTATFVDWAATGVYWDFD